jgi:hypothetical protein
MVIITQISYPPESSKDMAKRFLEAPQFPDWIVRKGPYVSANMKNGLSIISVAELENARLAEGLDFIVSYMTIFYGVPGFKYEVKPFFNIDEALKLIGMG